MPPRNAPTRASQRRNSQQDQDDTPTRTRGRGAKPAPSKPDALETVAPKHSPTKLSPTITRKTTRSASNISGNSFEVASEVYASYEHPLLMDFGLSPEFFDGLKKHHGKLPKERKSIVGSFADHSSDVTESEGDSTEEDELEAPVAPQPAPRGRGRGGRGARGGRGRGSRGRGRGGRGRGGVTKATSSAPSRTARNAVSMFPLTEEDDDQPSNQSTPNSNAKPPTTTRLWSINPVSSSGDENENAIEDDDSEPEFERIDVVQQLENTPQGSPPPNVQDSIGEAPAPQLAPEQAPKPPKKSAIPRIALLPNSASQTPQESAATPTESAVPKLLDPEEDVLSDSDLPDPFMYDAPSPIEADCEDRADYLLQKRFKPLADIQAAVAALTKFPASQRSTENLYALSQNSQLILKAWQDEYLVLDARVSVLFCVPFRLLTNPDRSSHASSQEGLQWRTHPISPRDLRRHEGS